MSSEFCDVVELVQVEVTRFTHKLNCFDGSVSHWWIYQEMVSLNGLNGVAR